MPTAPPKALRPDNTRRTHPALSVGPVLGFILENSFIGGDFPKALAESRRRLL
jgi:hypothetical protein